MAVKLNHIIVHSKDPRAAAEFFTGLFGLPAPKPFGPFHDVRVGNEVTLAFLPAGVSHATVAWVAASKAGFKVRVMDVTGAYWNDVGDPATFARGVLDALRERGETVYLSAGARCGKVEIDGYVVLESGSQIRDGARVRNCILMPGADATGEHENSIVGPDYEISLAEADMQPSIHAASSSSRGIESKKPR